METLNPLLGFRRNREHQTLLPYPFDPPSVVRASLGVFRGIDSIWLRLIAPKFYRSQIGHLMTDKANLITVLVFFVVAPGMSMPMREVILRGGLFGPVTYTTYDLTNLATLRNWLVLVPFVDVSWGMVLTAETFAVVVWLAGVLNV